MLDTSPHRFPSFPTLATAQQAIDGWITECNTDRRTSPSATALLPSARPHRAAARVDGEVLTPLPVGRAASHRLRVERMGVTVATSDGTIRRVQVRAGAGA